MSGTRNGLEEGREQGREQGEKTKAKEIAIRLLKNGLDIEMVRQATELSFEEIEKLKQTLK